MKSLDAQTFRVHFYERISAPNENGCTLWLGSPGRPRYGYVWRGGKNRLAHRVAYELRNGPIPSGMCVCHKCDVPKCVNPKHLFLGTHLDNIRDRSEKGRTRCYKAGDVHYMRRRPDLIRRGESSGNAVLTAAKVSRIKRMLKSGGMKHWKIAERFGVDRGTITHINRGVTWSHV